MAKTKNTGLVIVENNQAITTSLKVAEQFDKEHLHVMRDIRTLIQQMASTSHNPKLDSAKMFQETTYQSEEGGRRYPMYLMTRDGFSLLAMGFTGKKALQFKLKFIDAFNRMEKKLATLTPEEIQRQKIRRTGIDFGRKPCMEQIHKFNQRDFADGDKDPRGKARYGRYTKRTQIDHAGIPAGGRDLASGAELAAQFAGERASATIFARGLANDASYNPTENKAVEAFKSIYDLIFNNEYLENPPSAPLLSA